MQSLRALFLASLAFALGAPVASQHSSDLEIDYESYTLDNGLGVVLHVDRSDPIAAVAIQYHVGSNREVPGRTGFAHLFEHMMFQSSQHVAEDQFFKKIEEAGGTLNGGTSYDNTTYFEVVPKNALEMVMWLESDRMGYLLPTVTDEAFLNQQDVVQNEKRQRVDNLPYGHTTYVTGKLLYPEDHPYNWDVIGSFEDLANAPIEDLQSFFRRWYGPNNATLVVAGDIDVSETKAWIQKYFGELRSSPAVADPEPRAVSLAETKRAFHEDNFARSAELNMSFPTVEQYHADAYPLRLLALLISDGKNAPLYKTVVEEEQLAPAASAFQRSLEVAGTFRFWIRAFPGKSLTDVERAVHTALERFESERFTDADLNRIKSGYEMRFYNRISSVLNKAFQLAAYNESAGSPGFISEDLASYLAVTSDDVWRVYNQYVKDEHYVITSFVPKGQVELVAEGSERFPIVEEAIETAGVAGTERAAAGSAVAAIPSSFDRSTQPPMGRTPEITLPEIWTHTYSNGLRVFGIELNELPLVQFGLTIKGGMLLDEADRVGVANLVTDIMMQGTRDRTPIELEEAIDALGANINMFTGRESISIQANTLRSKLDDVFAIFEEMLLEPRWDVTEFERIQRQTIEMINRRGTSAAAVAGSVFTRLVYGDDHILGNSTFGTVDAVESFTVDDLRRYYETNYAANISYLTVVGDIASDEAIELFRSLGERWRSKEVMFPTYADPTPATEPAVYFVDIPQARQSEIRIGHVGLTYEDPDYYATSVMNHALGGSFNGRVNMILREEKGYTYGARSGFSGSSYSGSFTASAAVRSNVTLESVQIFKDELEKFRQGITAAELAFTKGNLIQGNARRFETLGALRSMLNTIGTYGLPLDYIKDREQVVYDMTLERHQELANMYINPEQLIFLVVGDADTQYERLEELGLGPAIMLDRDGKRVPVVF